MPLTPDHDHDDPLDTSGVSVFDDHDVADKAVPPPPPPTASAEEKELYWFQHIYQGDRMPQLTWRAVLMGGILGMFMAISNLYTTIKLGWGFGVGITACVLSFAIWHILRGIARPLLAAPPGPDSSWFSRFLRKHLTPMSILENNCMQSTAMTAGATTGNTIATAFGAYLLFYGHHLGWPILFPYVLLAAALGCFLAIPMKRQLINVEQLPFPSGMAAAETLRSLHGKGREAMHKAMALVSSIFVGAFVGLLKAPKQTLVTLDYLYQYVHIPEIIPFRGFLNPVANRGLRLDTVGLDPGVLMLGAGAFIGTRVCLSMLAGSVLLQYVVVPVVLQHDAAMAGVPGYRAALEIVDGGLVKQLRWSVWGGTAVIVFSSLTALALQWRTMARAFGIFKKRRGQSGHAFSVLSAAESSNGPRQGRAVLSVEDEKAQLLAKMDEIEVPFWWLVAGVVPIGIGLVVLNYLAFKMSLLLGIVSVAMSWLAALVCCRASGETDIPPMGAVGKLTQLLYAMLAKGNTTVNLMSAGVTAAAGASAADLLTDLKSGYLLGANPRKQFLAQFYGVFFGAVVVTPAWFLMIPDKAALEKYNPPGPNMWLAMAKLLANGVDTLHPAARVAILVGALVGIGLPLISALLPKTSRYLPSVMGLGLGFVVPFISSLSFAIGAVLAWVWLKIHKPSADAYTYPISAGLIAGESIVLALIAMAATASGLIWPK